MGCGQSKTEHNVTKETRTTVSQSPQRADISANPAEKNVTTTTTTTTADATTTTTTGNKADKKSHTGDVIMVGKNKDKTKTTTTTTEEKKSVDGEGDEKKDVTTTEKKTKTTTTEKHTDEKNAPVKETHEDTKKVINTKQENVCPDEVIDKIKLSSPTVKAREELELAFAQRLIPVDEYGNYIISEPYELYPTAENNLTITSTTTTPTPPVPTVIMTNADDVAAANDSNAANNVVQLPEEVMSSNVPVEQDNKYETSGSTTNANSLSPIPQSQSQPLIETNVIATRVYEVHDGKSPEPVPQQTAEPSTPVYKQDSVNNSSTQKSSNPQPAPLYAHPHSLQSKEPLDEEHHNKTRHSLTQTHAYNAETESSKQKRRDSTPRALSSPRDKHELHNGVTHPSSGEYDAHHNNVNASHHTPRGASRSNAAHPTPKDKSSTARSLAKLHTTATSRLANQYADQQHEQQQQQQQEEPRSSSSHSQPRDKKPTKSSITPLTKEDKNKSTQQSRSVAGQDHMNGEAQEEYNNNHHHHHHNNHPRRPHDSALPAKDKITITRETELVKSVNVNGVNKETGKPMSVTEVTVLTHDENIKLPEVVQDGTVNAEVNETNESGKQEPSSSEQESSTLRQLYNRIASYTRILPTTQSRSQSQAQADSEIAKQEEQTQEEAAESQAEQPQPRSEQKQEQEKELELKKETKEESQKEAKVEEEREESSELEQPPSHYWRHSQSINGPISHAADNAPTTMIKVNGVSKLHAATQESATNMATTSDAASHAKPKPLREAIERDKAHQHRRLRKTPAQKYNALYNLENDAASIITAQSYRPKYNHLVRAQAMNSINSVSSQRSAELKESNFERNLRKREEEAKAEAGEQSKSFSPESTAQPEAELVGPMWVTVVPNDANASYTGGWGLLRQIRTLIQLSRTAAV